MFARCREKLHEAHSDLQKKKEVIDDLEPKVDSNSETCQMRAQTLEHWLGFGFILSRQLWLRG